MASSLTPVVSTPASLTVAGYASAYPDSPYCYPDYAIPDDDRSPATLTAVSVSPPTLTPL